MDYEGDAPQEYEHIPWSQLVPVQKDRSMQLAALVVVIAAALLAVVLLARRSPEVAPVALPVTATTTNPAVVAGESAPVPTVAVAATAPVPTLAGPQIYSEADLMAALPPQPELAAIARAEWFVTDFFTVDGDRALAEAVTAALPDAVELPASDGSLISYVEWARAVAVADHLDGTFDVTVWFRTLVGSPAGGFARTAVRAVDVHLVTDESGRLAVADLPRAARVEPLGLAPSWPVGATPPPQTVARAADSLDQIGETPELLDAGRDEDGWRLVFSVGDASGMRFPITVRVPQE